MPLPDFTLQHFRMLLTDLRSSGYSLLPVTSMRDRTPGLEAFLRHDVDLHIAGIERVGEIEADLNVSATYYVPLTQPFNPFYPANRRRLMQLVAMGHEIGLHYDLELYPRDPAAALEHLRREADMLRNLVEAPVRTISTHLPYKGLPDPFLDVDDLVHPHSPALSADLTYVSDSCRAWRDETLLRCFSDEPPRRLLLSTHPELWLGEAGQSRQEYLRTVVIPNALGDPRSFYREVVGKAWREYAAAHEHDRRVSGRPT